jgi:hypothetical protein
MATELARESELFLGVMARHSGCEEEKIAPAIDSVLGSNAKDIKARLNQFDSAFTTSFAPLLRGLKAQAQALAQLPTALAAHNVYEEEAVLRPLDRDLTSAQSTKLTQSVEAALSQPVAEGMGGAAGPLATTPSTSTSFVGPNYPFCK